MKDLNLKQRQEIRDKFVSDYFSTKSSAAHTENTLGRVLEDYEKEVISYLEKQENEALNSPEEVNYYILTLQYKEVVDYHTLKVPIGILPHSVIDNSEEIKEGVKIVSYNSISKEEFNNSQIYRILPPEMTTFKNDDKENNIT